MNYKISSTAARALDEIFPSYFYYFDGIEFFTSDEWLSDAITATLIGSDGEPVDLSTRTLEEMKALAALPYTVAPDHFTLYELIEGYKGDRSATPKAILLPQNLSEPLYKDYMLLWGERTDEIYYATRNPDGSYSDEVARVHYTFNRDADNFYALSRDAVMSWMLGNQSVSVNVKRWTKHFTLVGQINEIKARRENLIADIQQRAIAFGIKEAVNQLFTDFTVEIARWRDSGSRDFLEGLQAATAATYPWIDAPIPANPLVEVPEGFTVKDLLVATFSIATLPPTA